MKCLNCEAIIIKKGAQLENGSFAWAVGEPKKVKYESGKRFVRCPNCKAKNILGDVPNDEITWIQEKFVSFEFD